MEQRQYLSVASTHVHTLRDALNGYQGHRYLVIDGRLVKLFQWDHNDDLYIPQEDGNLMLYREHLDGPTLDKEEARAIFPEEFI